jgi:glucose dehydrogenase
MMLLASALGPAPSPAQSRGGAAADLLRLQADDAQWVMAAKNYASTRYSGLAEINADNVGRLRLAWKFATGVERGQEAAPLVVGTTMYVVMPFPNVVYALDLTRPGTVRWKHEPNPAPAAQGIACCDVVNRGAAYADGRIFFNTLDAQTIALDAGSGRELWRTQVGDINPWAAAPGPSGPHGR